ncbi:MAG: RnfABCDGE type electron transport complex subunit B [Candidatus Margulisbacteria bacterium]|jgi:Na+-translocating ferredoxin:NAD+ oxidoreductase RNF subunit RnfB|nr:RnfABCDGE type electron transport complex subunit B [Candidatus Margulisiibacteriota bacterium]
MMAGFWALTGLGVTLGVILGLAALFLLVKASPLAGQLLEILPGYNCGACGSAGCAGYAELLAGGKAALNLCAPGGADTGQKIAALLGKEAAAVKEKNVVWIFCGGGVKAVDAYVYSGMHTCRAAMLVQGGYKKCRFGCLGFGDCSKVCQFGAIVMGEDGLPVIDRDKCLDCGACIRACPKGLLRRVVKKELKLVLCSNHDRGPSARAVCAAPCTACGLCVKNCPYQAIALRDNLAVIDPAKCTNCGVCAGKCPTKAIA